MRPLLLLTFFVGCFQLLTAQTATTKTKQPKQKGNLNCVHKEKFSTAERNRFYPFEVTSTVQLVSFRYHENDYPIKHSSVTKDSLIEFKTLSQSQTATLTDILYNNFYKKQPNYALSTQCFIPRNAILFLDQSGHMTDYILICFHCDTHKESSNKINFGDECSEKMEKLRQFFVSLGVKFGTDKDLQKYPGESFE